MLFGENIDVHGAILEGISSDDLLNLVGLGSNLIFWQAKRAGRTVSRIGSEYLS